MNGMGKNFGRVGRISGAYDSNMLPMLFNHIIQGGLARHTYVWMYNKRSVEGTLEVLIKEGYILGYKPSPEKRKFQIFLKYDKGKPLITQFRQVSSPSRYVHIDIAKLPPFMRGLGIWLICNPKYRGRVGGMLSDLEARKLGISGELCGSIF